MRARKGFDFSLLSLILNFFFAAAVHSGVKALENAALKRHVN